MKKSFKDYAIYFFTLILGVSIFYIFNAIESQTVMLTLSKSGNDMIRVMTKALSGVSVFVSIVLGLLIIYASRFLMKRRNKEFGVYMTLGMSKTKISKILLFETIFIGLISLVVGLIIGVVLSQVMSIVVANMFKADMQEFTFVFSMAAMVKTILYFAIMYVLVMLLNTFQVSKCKLIDLLQASKKSEQIKMKNPYLCILVFFFAIGLLSYAYYNVTIGVGNLKSFGSVVIQMVYGAISTFLIFWSLSGLLLKTVMSMKNMYHHRLNSFTVRQISSKINTTVMSMTVICLMLFLTICIFSSAISMNNASTANLEKLAPVDLCISKRTEATLQEDGLAYYTPEQIADSTVTIEESLQSLDFDIDGNLQDIHQLSVYDSKEVTLKDTLGSQYEQTKENFPFLSYDSKEPIVAISEYNALASLYHLPTFSLQDNEYIMIANYDSMLAIRDGGLQAKAPLLIQGKEYLPKYSECQDGYITVSTNAMNDGIVILPDQAVTSMQKKRLVFAANYKVGKGQDKQDIEAKVEALSEHPLANHMIMSASTKISLYDASRGLGAMAVFIGLYLGIIFLISSAAILALKELSDSSDNRERYAMLRKIGADDKMIHSALFRQIAIFFAFPLLLAIIHSIFGIQVCNYMLSVLGNDNMLSSIIITAIFLVGIYGGYFMITYLCSKNIIKE